MWHFQPILDSYLVVALLATLLIASLLVRPTFGAVSAARRWLLVGLRAVAVLAIVLAMLRPTRVHRTEQTQTATLVLVVDTSRSMSVADMQGQARWRVLLDTLKELKPELEQLGSKVEVRVYGFDESASMLAFDGGSVSLPEEPEGQQSDIGSSLYDVLRMEAGKRLTGVILLSDGAQRATSPRVDLQQPAREMARLQYPLYTVAFGMPRDPSQSRDAAIQELSDHYTVFVKNQLPVRGSVWLQGLSNREIPLTMRVTRPDGNTETVETVSIQAEQPAEAVPFELSYTPDEPGEYRLTVEVPVQPGELVSDNNELTSYVTVLDGGVRVLYLDGNVASQEPKFVQRSLGESPEIELDYQLILPAGAKNWPVSLPQLDAKPPYDVFLIGDLDSDAIGSANAERMAQRVSEGRGLMMLGGLHSFGPGGYGATPLADVLPVEMTGLQRQRFNAPIRTDQHWEGELRMIPKFPHYITQLAPGEENQAVWSRLPPLIGANRLGRLNERALVLLAGEADQPLLVASQYGAGRVLAFAGDSTFRWHRHGHTAEHKRFWRQLILWLAQQEDLSQSDVWVRMNRRRYLAGARAEFSVGARDDAGNSLEDVTFELALIDPDGQSTPLTASREGDVWRGITPVLQGGGAYQVQATALRDGSELKTVRTEFLVRTEDLELSDPAASPEQLSQLAQWTEAHGGRAIAPEQLGDLLKEIYEQPNEVKVELESKWQLGDTLPDAWILFLTLVGLLSADWVLRKRWRMV